VREIRAFLAGLVAAAVCSACGSAETPRGAEQPSDAATPAAQTLDVPGAGLSIRYPAGWDATIRPLTEVVWPPERLAAATYPLAALERGSNCNPGPALAALPREGALLHLFEYTERAGAPRSAKDFPERPALFRLDPSSLLNYECAGRSYAVVFSDGGRRLQAHVWFGDDATESTRAEALEILNSLEVEPAGGAGG